MYYSKLKNHYFIWIVATVAPLSSCSTMSSAPETVQPISNPFYAYTPGSNAEGPPLVLRSKKGDRSVEVEIPGQVKDLGEFAVPISPEFKDGGRRIASVYGSDSSGATDDTYRNRTATPTDHEITRSFSQGSPEDLLKRREIEKGLNLNESEEGNLDSGTPSYLAKLDHIKQLYRASRFEVALIETDDMIKDYQTDPKLYEMRGTLLDRLGRRELATKSWMQALKLNPANVSLRKFIERKQIRSLAGVQ